VLELFDYGFPENGLAFYRVGELVSAQSFINHLGEEKYKKLVNFILHYIADMDVPIKRYLPICYKRLQKADELRGTFVEFRKSMINVSPIGRNARFGFLMEEDDIPLTL
jgi:phosphomannomutase